MFLKLVLWACCVANAAQAEASIPFQSLVTRTSISIQNKDRSWTARQDFPSLEKAQRWALSQGALDAQFLLEFNAPPFLCELPLPGLYLDFIYDQDRTLLNGRVIGATGDPATSERRLSLVPRAYPIPKDVLKCGSTNILEMQVRRILGGWIGPNLQKTSIGEFSRMQELALYHEALTPLLQRDIGVFLFAIAFLLFGLFWRYSQNQHQTAFAVFSLMVALLCLSLSGWYYRYSNSPQLNFRLHVLTVSSTLLALLRYVCLHRGIKRLEQIPHWAYLGVAVLGFGTLCLLVRDAGTLLQIYLYAIVVISGTSFVLWLSPLFTKAAKWGDSRITEFALFFIHFGVLWDVARIWRVHNFENISPYTFGVCTAAIAIVLAHRLTEVFEKAAKSALVDARNKELSAIAQTVRMLAHDVRRPFTLLKMGLGSVQHLPDGDQRDRFLTEMVLNVDQALASVNGMVEDVMSMGPTTVQQLPQSLVSVLQASLMECFRIHPKASIEVEYRLNHKHCAHIDVAKIQRVISNLVDNAVSAMEGRGKLRFETSEAKGWITLTLWNSGTYIPPEDRAQLFEPFFTKNKRNGTGLGLAIARTFVIQHGGDIECDSILEKGTCFTMTLPLASDFPDQGLLGLRKTHSDQFREVAMETNASEEKEIEGELLELLQRTDKKMRLLVVDDELVYLDHISKQIAKHPALAAHFELVPVQRAGDAIDEFNRQVPNVIICDVELSDEKHDGFSLVRYFRNTGSRVPICMHSNSLTRMGTRQSLESGADHFMPKPMERIHLLKFLLDSARSWELASQGIPSLTNIDSMHHSR